MIGNEFVAATFQLGDLFAQRRHPHGQMAGLGGTCLQHSRVIGRRGRGADGVDTLLDEFFAAMVLAEERAQGAIVTALQVLQIGPAMQQVRYERRIEVGEPLQQLREILFQTVLQAQREGGLVVDELTAIFDQHQQQARVGVIGLEAVETVAVAREQVEYPVGVAGVVFGAGGHEGLPVRGRHGWRHGEQYQVRVRKKQVHDRTSFLLERDGDRLAAETAIQLGGPDGDRFRGVVDDPVFGPAGSGLKSPSVFLTAPIQGDERGPNGLRRSLLLCQT